MQVPDVSNDELYHATRIGFMRSGFAVIGRDAARSEVVTDTDRLTVYGCEFSISWVAKIRVPVVCLDARWRTKNSAPAVCFRAAVLWETVAREILERIREEVLILHVE
jgi:hypothetical protein